jgi:L-lactate dehydrogenase complex protein LldF
MRGEPPSHIIFPAIHLKREEIGELFSEKLGTEAGLSDPTLLTEAARTHLREKFFEADAGITGVNFAVAETGGLVVVTNEGNADLGTSLPKLHIACMGIEKLVPRVRDLAVFMRLLARSATGQPITVYSSHFHGPAPEAELHIVLVDNGRSQLLSSEPFRDALACIRCGACLNTCPVYRRSGGYSYDTTIPGPIGSVLAPARSVVRHHSLPTACSLCGSCRDVCPVQIDLPRLLLAWRKEIVARDIPPLRKRLLAKFVAIVLGSPALYRTIGTLGRRGASLLPRFARRRLLGSWSRGRELPDLPRQSFRALHRKRRAE